MKRLNLLLTGLIVARALSAASVAVVTTGDEYCNTIRLPGGWRVPEEDKFGEFQRGTEYEFRRLNAATGEYLIAAISTEAHWRKQPADYTLNKFWVDLTGNQRARLATEQEWNSATIAPASGELFDVRGSDPRHGDNYLFGRNSFAKSGPRWPALGDQVRISDDGKWIAVQSWKGNSYQDAPDLMLQVSLDGSERFFVDIYDVASGKKLISLDGIDRDFSAGDAPLHATFWLDSRYFILPLGILREKFLVCEVPATFSDDLPSE